MVHTAYSTSIKKDNWDRKFCEELRLSYLTITANRTNGESWLPSNSFVCVCVGGGRGVSEYNPLQERKNLFLSKTLFFKYLPKYASN